MGAWIGTDVTVHRKKPYTNPKRGTSKEDIKNVSNSPATASSISTDDYISKKCPHVSIN
jgi:hypothetical protein